MRVFVVITHVANAMNRQKVYCFIAIVMGVAYETFGGIAGRLENFWRIQCLFVNLRILKVKTSLSCF